jgi:hypothetical protein
MGSNSHDQNQVIRPAHPAHMVNPARYYHDLLQTLPSLPSLAHARTPPARQLERDDHYCCTMLGHTESELGVDGYTADLLGWARNDNQEGDTSVVVVGNGMGGSCIDVAWGMKSASMG